MQAVFFGSEEGKDAGIQLINAGLAGERDPDWQDSRASRLVPLTKQSGGTRPIAIGVGPSHLHMCNDRVPRAWARSGSTAGGSRGQRWSTVHGSCYQDRRAGAS